MSTNINNNNVDIEKAAVVVEKAEPLEQHHDDDNEQQHVTPVTSSFVKTKKYCLVTIATLVLVALVIGLSVGLTNKNKDAEDTTSMTLEELCASEEDQEACHSVCESAMCCFESGKQDCVVAMAEECDLYQACRVFVKEGGYSLPGADAPPFSGNPPTIEVETICHSEYGEVGDITCEEACWQANCCYWTGEESCYQEHAAICEEWKEAGCFQFSDPFGQDSGTVADTTNEQEGGFSIPGGIALEEGEILEEPGQAVYDICGAPGASATDITCEEACAKAACCYWAGEDGCYNDFQVTCDLWLEAGCFEFSVEHEQEVP